MKLPNLVRVWQTISQLGVKQEVRANPTPEWRGIVLSNQINFVLGCLFFLVVVTDILLLGKIDDATIRYMAGMAFTAGALFLNYLRWYTFGRFLLVLLIPCLFLIFPAVNQSTHEVSLLWMPTGIVVYTIIPYLIFRWPQERASFLIAQVLLFAFTLLSDVLLRLGADPTFKILEVIDENYVQFKRSMVALWVLLNFPLIYFMRLVRRFEHRINTNHVEIQEKNLRIQQQNEELKAHQEQIEVINQNLERMVGDRTIELKHQNDRLAEYAFINAHLLRAPLARIQGLVYLMELSGKMPTDDLLFLHLKESVDEFNGVVQKINALVEEGHHFSREDFTRVLPPSNAQTEDKDPEEGL
ncbi:MAG TPA: hypothetical protein DCE41_35640 [Cytophagales bacterium]|nr:hypothetical protein [Cytophagales bacterium]HAA21092.1 hypothetical protein [Cytophagales bacterium]HAP65160.1 hypothetical protein [Cytophagales bacterium]